MTKEERTEVYNYTSIQLAISLLREVEYMHLTSREREMFSSSLGHLRDLGDSIERRLEERSK